MSIYILNLTEAVAALHGCDCAHSGTSRVVEFYEDRKVFDGDVETFTLSGHPKASEAFAWAFHNGTEPQYVAVLKLPPINDPSDAVRAAIGSGSFTPVTPADFHPPTLGEVITVGKPGQMGGADAVGIVERSGIHGDGTHFAVIRYVDKGTPMEDSIIWNGSFWVFKDRGFRVLHPSCRATIESQIALYRKFHPKG